MSEVKIQDSNTPLSENETTSKGDILAKGIMDLYLPSLIKAKEHMEELQEKQKVLTDHMHDQNMKLAKVHDLELKMQMFDKIKIYEKKLSVLKKDMKQLHEWSTKLKVRAQKIEEIYKGKSQDLMK